MVAVASRMVAVARRCLDRPRGIDAGEARAGQVRDGKDRDKREDQNG